MFNAERNRSVGMDSIEKSKTRIERALEKAERSLQDDAIRMEHFKHYEDYEKDLGEVKRLESEFKKKPPEVKRLNDLAKIFEALIHDNVELSNWFGKNVRTIRPTPYDDYINGIDEIVEFQEENSASYLALAIDATSSSNTTEKFRRIKKEIDEGVLPSIKYFRSEDFIGIKENVPRVVVEAHRQTIERVMTEWLEGEK